MQVTSEEILVLDFGSQYTQLIGRRIRETHVYSEILPFHTPLEQLRRRRPKGIILSGGPSSVYEDDAPGCDSALFELGIPILGVCYGMQLIAKELGGRVEPAHEREYGHGTLEKIGTSALLDGIQKVWMSHGDRILEPPPGFRVTAQTDTTMAAMECSEKEIFGVQFHPEVAHTENGTELLRRFVFDICHCSGTWSLGSFLEAEIGRVRDEVGDAQEWLSSGSHVRRS